MTFSICIRTVYRPQNYLNGLLRRLAETRTLEDRSVRGLHVSHGEGLTPNANAVRALRMSAADEADWILFLEDDIEIVNDFIGSVSRWLTDFARYDVLFYPLGSFYPFISKDHHERGAWDMGLDLYYGSQAVAFRARDAADYHNFLSFERPSSTWSYDAHFDMHLKEWQRSRHGSADITVTPAPGFVDHVGENSIMGTWSRTGRMLDFAGREGGYRGREHRSVGERSTVQGISV